MRRSTASAATGRSGRMGAVQRIRAIAETGNMHALRLELAPHPEDATLVECALKTLWALVKERGSGRLVFDGGGLVLVSQALNIHGADSCMAQRAFDVLTCTLSNVDDATLSAYPVLPFVFSSVVAVLDQHAGNLEVFWSGCDALYGLCSSARAVDIAVSSDVITKAAQLLHTSLEKLLNAGRDTIKVLRTLAELIINKTAVDFSSEAGCIDLVIAAMEFCGGETREDIHNFGCRALAHLCFGTSFWHLHECGVVEIALESLHEFASSAGVQANGLKILLNYSFCRGPALDRDCLGTDVVQAAIATLRMSCQRCAESSGMGVPLETLILDAMSLALSLITQLDELNTSTWMFPLLDEPETADLLKRAPLWLERAGKVVAKNLPAFVQRMTQGACCGCGELQGEKMKRCARCGLAAYCSPLCQRLHWPEHKRECKPPPAAAAVARDAE